MQMLVHVALMYGTALYRPFFFGGGEAETVGTVLSDFISMAAIVLASYIICIVKVVPEPALQQHNHTIGGN